MRTIKLSFACRSLHYNTIISISILLFYTNFIPYLFIETVRKRGERELFYRMKNYDKRIWKCIDVDKL